MVRYSRHVRSRFSGGTLALSAEFTPAGMDSRIDSRVANLHCSHLGYFIPQHEFYNEEIYSFSSLEGRALVVVHQCHHFFITVLFNNYVL